METSKTRLTGDAADQQTGERSQEQQAQAERERPVPGPRAPGARAETGTGVRGSGRLHGPPRAPLPRRWRTADVDVDLIHGGWRRKLNGGGI